MEKYVDTYAIANHLQSVMIVALAGRYRIALAVADTEGEKSHDVRLAVGGDAVVVLNMKHSNIMWNQ